MRMRANGETLKQLLMLVCQTKMLSFAICLVGSPVEELRVLGGGD